MKTNWPTKKLGIPHSAEKYYKIWIGHHPESGHSTDMELFYMFISVLLSKSRKERNRQWLFNLLKEDCNKLTTKQVNEFCDIYDHIKNYLDVWKSHTAKLILLGEIKKHK